MYDNTDQACAVIRFFVRDTTFVVEGNMGVVKRISQLGEIMLYVPAATKRLTVRHEGLLPLRYELPSKLEPKKTYDAYLLALKTPQRQENAYQQRNTTNGRTTPEKDKNVGKPDRRLKESETKADDSDQNLIATRQYAPLKVQLRYGYEFSVANIAKDINLSIAPVIGGSLNVFNSKTEANEYREYFKRASSVSLAPGVRASVQVGDHLLMHMTPEFALGVYKSDNCKVISNSNKNFKKWTDGFNLSLGINYIF